jgi:hypothetical protein
MKRGPRCRVRSTPNPYGVSWGFKPTEANELVHECAAAALLTIGAADEFQSVRGRQIGQIGRFGILLLAQLTQRPVRKATSCFGCSITLFVFPTAALDEDLGLEVDVGAALNIVAYVVAVFLWR